MLKSLMIKAMLEGRERKIKTARKYQNTRMKLNLTKEIQKQDN